MGQINIELFVELLQIALGKRDGFSRIPTEKEWITLYEESEKQAIVGVMLGGLGRLPKEQLPFQELLLQWIGIGEIIRQRNAVMDDAVVRLCEGLTKRGTHLFVFKGQTINFFYPKGLSRDSGDIDYLVSAESWEKELSLIKERVERGEIKKYIDDTTEKDVQYAINDIAYEMHNKMVLFSRAKHQEYWEKVVMPKIWERHYVVEINGHAIMTLPPVENVLYIFVHIFHHLIADGIGLRQFVDWFVLLNAYDFTTEEKDELEKHLSSLGLRTAFTGLGAVLTDYLGMEECRFPFHVTKEDHKEAPKLLDNIMQMGNFGHNINYSQDRGVIHGLQHLGRIFSQSRKFGHYAPSESWGRIPKMFSWWSKKLWMVIYR